MAEAMFVSVVIDCVSTKTCGLVGGRTVVFFLSIPESNDSYLLSILRMKESFEDEYVDGDRWVPG